MLRGLDVKQEQAGPQRGMSSGGISLGSTRKSECKALGDPLMVMALGGFLGGMAAATIQAGFLGFVVLALGSAYGLLAALGSLGNAHVALQPRMVLLLAFLPMLVGFIGMLLGTALLD